MTLPPPPGPLPADFDGCSRDCRAAAEHTLAWGRCDHAEQPPRPDPEFGFWRTTLMGDGQPSIHACSIPLLAVLPWAARLSADERWRMLEEAADTEDPPQSCVHGSGAPPGATRSRSTW